MPKKTNYLPKSKAAIFIFTLVLIVLFVPFVINTNLKFNNESDASEAITIATIELSPTADTITNRDYPTRNYGSLDKLTIDKDSERTAFYLFDLTAYAGRNLDTANLLLTVESRSATQQEVYAVSNTSWTESALTYNTKPALGTIITTIPQTENGQVTQVNLSSYVRDNLGKKVAFAIKNNTTDGLVVYSKESTHIPKLKLDFSTVATATPTASPIVVITPKPTATPVLTPVPTQTPIATQYPTPTITPVSGSTSIWITKDELTALKMEGPAWTHLLSDAKQNTDSPDFTNQNDKTDTYTVAKALVYAKTGDRAYGDQVVKTLRAVVTRHPISNSKAWDWLGILRSLGSYAISASLIDLSKYDPTFDQTVWRPWLTQVRSAIVEGGRGSVISAQEKRPNNFGSHATASRIAADLYLNDTADLARAIQVFKGYLGDRSQYSNTSSPGFVYGSDLSWQANPSQPVGINPKGATLTSQRFNVDGVIPDDQRRAGAFTWPPKKTNYTWEGSQGNIVAAELLHRAGYPAYEWGDRALLRAVQWHYNTTFSTSSTTEPKNFPATGDDVWMLWIINKRYGTSYSAASGVSAGKMMGYTDWTHQ